jgi:hypothetical protein
MKRKTLTIKQLLDCAYSPVDFFQDEDDQGNSKNVICLDMLCLWRLADGKVLFAEVPFNNKEELEAILTYIEEAADRFHKIAFNWTKEKRECSKF